jgi:hypothetical protein
LHAAPSKRWSSVEELAQQYTAIVRKHNSASAPDLTFSGVQTPLTAAPQTGRLRRVFMVMALVMLSCVAALTWKHLSTRAPAIRRAQPAQLATTPGAIAPAAAAAKLEPPPQSTGAMVAPAAPVELKLPQSQLKPQPQPPPQPVATKSELPEEPAPLPPPKAAAPRAKTTAKTAPRSAPPEPPTPNDNPRPPPSELPGRNHGF